MRELDDLDDNGIGIYQRQKKAGVVLIMRKKKIKNSERDLTKNLDNSNTCRVFSPSYYIFLISSRQNNKNLFQAIAAAADERRRNDEAVVAYY